MRKKEIWKRICSLAVSISLIAGALPVQAVETQMPETTETTVEIAETAAETASFINIPANPVHHCTKDTDASGTSDTTDFSYVYFGSYPQTEAKDAATLQLLDAQEIKFRPYHGATVWLNGECYRYLHIEECVHRDNFTITSETGRDYKFFKWEPIKWRVLQNDGESLLLFSDCALDCSVYDGFVDCVSPQDTPPCDWQHSDMRSFLNESFLKKAFTDEEKKAIMTVTTKNAVENSTNPANQLPDTQDKVVILAPEELTNPAYGFCSSKKCKSATRRMAGTPYAITRGAVPCEWHDMTFHTQTGTENNVCYWTFGRGSFHYLFDYVGCVGSVKSDIIPLNYRYWGVCPVIRVNLSEFQKLCAHSYQKELVMMLYHNT